MSEPVLSLCMPTNGVVEWVFPVLDSIFKQNCSEKLFEVVITDNGNNTQFKERIKKYISMYGNIKYSETNALPFLNEIEAYRRASGRLIKFVNHRTMLVEGALQKLIDFVADNEKRKPVVYFSNGVLDIPKSLNEYKSFDEFVKNLSYWSSWSTGMAIWKSDFDKLPQNISEFNELFPHTDILFNVRDRESYILENSVIFNELPVNGIPKAKYDLFYAFTVEYPGIILKLLMDGDISTETFLSVKNDNLLFVAKLYYDFVIRKKPCSYILTNYRQCIKVFYSHKRLLLYLIKKAVKKIMKG